MLICLVHPTGKEEGPSDQLSHPRWEENSAGATQVVTSDIGMSVYDTQTKDCMKRGYLLGLGKWVAPKSLLYGTVAVVKSLLKRSLCSPVDTQVSSE